MTKLPAGLRGSRALLLLTVVQATLLTPSGGRTATATSAGGLDPTFGSGGKVTTPHFSGTYQLPAFFGGVWPQGGLALQADGKLVASSQSSQGGFAVARYLPDGNLDSTFGVGGRVDTDSSSCPAAASAVVVQPDGKVVAGGGICQIEFLGQSLLVRYLPDGSPDSAFGNDGRVVTAYGWINALVLQPDGKLVAAGGFGAVGPGGVGAVLRRYMPDGSLDTTFGVGCTSSNAFQPLNALALQPDGKLLVGGISVGSSSLSGVFYLGRLLSNGCPDPSFGTEGVVTSDFGQNQAVTALALQEDGKVIAAGGSVSFLGGPPPASDFLLARYLPGGSLDATFGVGGKVTTDFGVPGTARARAVVVQEDGKLVVGGVTSTAGATYSNFALARYNPDGTLDGSFGTLGKATTGFGPVDFSLLTALVIQPDGKLVASGLTTPAGPTFSLALARYLPDQPTCVVNTLAALPEAQGVPDVTAVKSGARAGFTASAVERAARATRLDPEPFRRLRDQVLVRSPAGRRYAALYSAHSTEVVRLMLMDSALRAAILEGLLLWQAHVTAIADGSGAAVTITADQAAAVDAVANRLAKAGSPALRKAIAEEQRMHLPGFNLAQTVIREIGRTDNGR